MKEFLLEPVQDTTIRPIKIHYQSSALTTMISMHGFIRKRLSATIKGPTPKHQEPCYGKLLKDFVAKVHICSSKPRWLVNHDRICATKIHQWHMIVLIEEVFSSWGIIKHYKSYDLVESTSPKHKIPLTTGLESTPSL